MKTQIPASAAEWEVMRVVWSLEVPTSRDVATILKSSQNWEANTTKTLLSRLVKKGYLSTQKEGKRYIYTALVTEQDSVDQKIDDVFASICATAVGGAIASAIRIHPLSTHDKKLILDALNAVQPVESVTCSCASNHHDCACDPADCLCPKS